MQPFLLLKTTIW